MGRFTSVIARTWLAEQQYGWRFAPHIGTFSLPYVYAKTMLYAAGADELRSQERTHIYGLAEVMLCKPDGDLLYFIENFPKDSNSTNSASIGLSNAAVRAPSVSRILLYDTLRAAIADGDYDQMEKVHVHRVVRHLGIPDGVASKIEEVALKEMELGKRKAALLRRV